MEPALRSWRRLIAGWSLNDLPEKDEVRQYYERAVPCGKNNGRLFGDAIGVEEIFRYPTWL